MHQSQAWLIIPLSIPLVMPRFLSLSNISFSCYHLRKFCPWWYHFFYFIRFTYSSACLLSVSVSSSGLNIITTGFFWHRPFISFFEFLYHRWYIPFTKQIYSFLCMHMHKHHVRHCLDLCMCICIIRHLGFSHHFLYLFLHASIVFMRNCSCLLTLMYDFLSVLGCNPSTHVPEFSLLFIHKLSSSLL